MRPGRPPDALLGTRCPALTGRNYAEARTRSPLATLERRTPSCRVAARPRASPAGHPRPGYLTLRRLPRRRSRPLRPPHTPRLREAPTAPHPPRPPARSAVPQALHNEAEGDRPACTGVTGSNCSLREPRIEATRCATSCAWVPCSTMRPLIEHEDAVARQHGREAVRDHERGAVLHQPVRARPTPRSRSRHRAMTSLHRASSSGASRRIARAIAMRWRWPPDSVTPRSPIGVS